MLPLRKESDEPAPIEIRTVSPEDGSTIWQMVKESGILDLNSVYSYLLLCREFGSTCLVAEVEEEIVGFVTAFKPPRREDTIFVWQVGVDPSQRGRGIAGTLLEELLALPACDDVEWLEATVTPSNRPSRKLFESLADRLEASCDVQPYLGPRHFPGDHEPEELFRIGPIPSDVSEGAVA